MAGADIRSVQELMGHKDITMTTCYSHLAPSRLKSTVELLVMNRPLELTPKLTPARK